MKNDRLNFKEFFISEAKSGKKFLSGAAGDFEEQVELYIEMNGVSKMFEVVEHIFSEYVRVYQQEKDEKYAKKWNHNYSLVKGISKKLKK